MPIATRLEHKHIAPVKAQNDVGFGTIVGSAVFNVLFVIGLSLGSLFLTGWCTIIQRHSCAIANSVFGQREHNILLIAPALQVRICGKRKH